MEFAVSLVPLKTGNLLLPSVRISAVSPDIFASTVYVNSAQQILVKPKSKTATFFVEQQRYIQQQQQQPPPPQIYTNVATLENSSRAGRSGIELSS